MEISSYAFVDALKACGSLGDLETGKRIHAHAIQRRVDSQIFVATALLDMYAKCGRLSDARRVFERMRVRDVVSWNAMIMGYAHAGEAEAALRLFARMQQQQFQQQQHEGRRVSVVAPTDRTFVAALKACACLAAREKGKLVDGRKCVKVATLKLGKRIHSVAAGMGFAGDVFVANTLLDMYAKCGSMEDAREVFERMPVRNVVSWNAILLGYAEREDAAAALQLFARMQHEATIAADTLTFVAALKACGSAAALEKGKSVHAEISRLGLEADPMVANSLVDMYGKCGSMGDAQRLFDSSMHTRKDVVAWNALIAGHSRRGDSKRVFELFQKMSEQEGVEADDVTFLLILTVCSHVGEVEEGRRYFEAMRADHGITPTIHHYNCMLDLLGRSGQLDAAMAMVKEMPFQANMDTWHTLLGACQKWKNAEVGKHAFESALRLDADVAASYVLMSNIYASLGMRCDESR